MPSIELSQSLIDDLKSALNTASKKEEEEESKEETKEEMGGRRRRTRRGRGRKTRSRRA